MDGSGVPSGDPRHPGSPDERRNYLAPTSTSSPSSVTLGLVQHRCATDSEENMRRAVAGVREAAGRGAQIVCLQELFRSQYFCQVEDHRCFDLAAPVPGPSTEQLGALARG